MSDALELNNQQITDLKDDVQQFLKKITLKNNAKDSNILRTKLKFIDLFIYPRDNKTCKSPCLRA